MSRLMKFSEAASLAIHSLCLLADAGEERRRAGEMARALGASENHLVKVLQRLARQGLVETTRGPRGGYALVRDPREVSLLDVYEVIEGPLGSGGCLLGKPVCDGRHCVLSGMVSEVHAMARERLAATTLADLAGAVSFKGASDDGLPSQEREVLR